MNTFSQWNIIHKKAAPSRHPDHHNTDRKAEHVSFPQRAANIDQEDITGRTPLMYGLEERFSCRKQVISQLKKLLDAGADINHRCVTFL